MRCETCRFFQPLRATPLTAGYIPGLCRGVPPSNVHVPNDPYARPWPNVRSTDWCVLHRAKDDEG